MRTLLAELLSELSKSVKTISWRQGRFVFVGNIRLLLLLSDPFALLGLFTLAECVAIQYISPWMLVTMDVAYPERTPPDLTPPRSPSAARKAETAKDRRTDGAALASLTTCVRSMLMGLCVVMSRWFDRSASLR